MCLRRAPEKYIAGAALDRAGLGSLLCMNKGALSLEVKRKGSEADQSPKLVPNSRKQESIHPLRHMSSWRSA
jgi:hypothetical protein